MFIRLAVILIGTVAVVVILWRMYLHIVVPKLRRNRIRNMEQEMEDLDRIIRKDKK